jgi:hypothetical protein
LEVQGVPGRREVRGEGEAAWPGELVGVLEAVAPRGRELEGVLEAEAPWGRAEPDTETVVQPESRPEALPAADCVPETLCVPVTDLVAVPENVEDEQGLALTVTVEQRLALMVALPPLGVFVPELHEETVAVTEGLPV